MAALAALLAPPAPLTAPRHARRRSAVANSVARQNYALANVFSRRQHRAIAAPSAQPRIASAASHIALRLRWRLTRSSSRHSAQQLVQTTLASRRNNSCRGAALPLRISYNIFSGMAYKQRHARAGSIRRAARASRRAAPSHITP